MFATPLPVNYFDSFLEDVIECKKFIDKPKGAAGFLVFSGETSVIHLGGGFG